MKKLKLIPDNTSIPFLKFRFIAFALSAFLIVAFRRYVLYGWAQ